MELLYIIFMKQKLLKLLLHHKDLMYKLFKLFRYIDLLINK